MHDVFEDCKARAFGSLKGGMWDILFLPKRCFRRSGIQAFQRGIKIRTEMGIRVFN